MAGKRSGPADADEDISAMAWQISVSVNCMSHKLVACLASISLKISSGLSRGSDGELKTVV